ncbi:MAG: KpsF/GutQ family sugar-phosphate isomerase [Marinobacter sp.]|jgi:arabinose-5-phosphate isomerase|nr:MULTISPECIES: KpsF/GutQ family sugar-phosphate isomerase [Gammaproteobacteria]MAP32300.1 KpsF/GutQ family sugar-phosphate isomerase [Marinobacter sp.]MBU73748.1 KpsF/GutQ family sugar-phosphate isomerase [Spongiibacter sp.]HCP20348.1 KpsF/GutQ family sugar-phosphate isomerase [Marinobacter nauticus]|tara:strand:- start:544 stop:1491 length:948 start_codon:yes stop_codon:yes gene_type:complete
MSSQGIGREVFEVQAEALRATAEKLSQEFDQAVDMILSTSGRVIVSGMGKSGIIGNKIAATLASTGTPSFSVHPAEAYHGDLGMFTADDVAILISYSGETEEVIRLVPSLRHFGVKIIALVGNPESTLGRNSDLVLDVSVEREACPNNLAPTTSTTVTLAMGDALAVALIERRQFKPHDFAVFHPGGSLGRRLLTRVKDVMHTDLPICTSRDSMKEVIMTASQAGLGLAVVVDDGEIKGIITDGDLRRALFNHDSLDGLTAESVMTRSPMLINENEMFADAENIMLKASITSLLVVSEQGALSGVLKLQDAGRVV